MPIIPNGWTEKNIVNAVGTGGTTTPFKYCKTLTIIAPDNLTDYITLIGKCNEPINRQLTINVINGKIDVYWINYNDELFIVNTIPLTTGDNLKDNDLDCLGIAFKCHKASEFFVTLRWDTDEDFYIYTGEDLMINPKVRLLLPTGANYLNANSASYDETNLAIYTENLNKLKNSNSGVTGYKLFDIFTFYPGKTIDFNVIVSNPANSIYGEIIAIQLFDPIDIAQSAIDIASDIINPESVSLSDSFIGNLTRNSSYNLVSDGKVIVTPDFSRHVGRIVAQNINNNNYFDTAIIESYTPNTDPVLGGTFTLTGEF